MASTTDPEPEEVEPACPTNLIGATTEWTTDKAAAYPPGYPRLCTDPRCFGYVDVGENGKAPDYDHREDVEQFVSADRAANGTKARHRPAWNPAPTEGDE